MDGTKVQKPIDGDTVGQPSYCHLAVKRQHNTDVRSCVGEQESPVNDVGSASGTST